jgi:small subunit ribosomal protein S15
MNYGVGEAEKEMLFEHLPPLSSELGGIRKPKTWTLELHEKAEKVELHKANMLARLIDLRNANAKGIAYENRRRVIAAFSVPGKPGDTGCPEVQGMQYGTTRLPSLFRSFMLLAALLTMKIRNLWHHLQRRKRDRGNRPRLTELVHRRANILKYLKSMSRPRYNAVLPRLGLEPESVEGELII